MKHHIQIKGVPLCEIRSIETEGVVCNHLTEVRAKTALLRLIERNPLLPICDYKIVPGVCPAVREIWRGEA